LIPVKNGASELRELLPRVLGQQCDASVEIVAVDSGSIDDTVEVLRQFSATVVTIDPQTFNHGLTRNLLANYARGDVLVFVNKLTLPADDRWLANLVAPLDHDPQVAGVYSRSLPRLDANLLTCRDELHSPPHRSIRAIADWNAYQALTPGELRAFIAFRTVSAAIRPEVLARIPFREVRTIAEDNLWAKEALEAGYKIQYEPSSIVLHSHNYSYLELLQTSFDGSLADRAFAGVRLDRDDLPGRVTSWVRDDWRCLEQRYWLDTAELEEWRIAAVIWRTAKIAGDWLGSNEDWLPGDVRALLDVVCAEPVSEDLRPYIEELRRSVDRGVARREQNRDGLSGSLIVPSIVTQVRDAWQALDRSDRTGSPDLEEARIRAAVLQITQLAGEWLGSNLDRLPSELSHWLSLLGRIRAGAVTEIPPDGAASLLQSDQRTPDDVHRDGPPSLSPEAAGALGESAYVQALSAALYQMGARVEERDRMLLDSNRVIQDLQSELHEKVGETNRVIAELQAEQEATIGDRDQSIHELQAELHEKVAEASRVIAELQAEQEATIGDRDQSIHELQAELHEKLGEANQVIADLQAEMHGKVEEANVVIKDLQAQLAAAQVERVQDSRGLVTAELAAEALAEHDRAIRTLEAELAALRQTGAWRFVNAYYGLRERLGAAAMRPRRSRGEVH
jgi:rhamnosyltransferase